MNSLDMRQSPPEVSTQLANDIKRYADNVWTLAEVGFEEVRSATLLANWIESEGFTITSREVVGMDTAWIATFGSGKPVLGILVEYDALPGMGNEAVPCQTPRKDGTTSGHACGHNLIGTGAIGAAIALKRKMEKDGIRGTLKVFGCPAEEELAGKNYMAKAGIFDDLDACLHWHPLSQTTTWNFAAVACADFWFEWSGKSAHAGTQPWDGRSALNAAELFAHGISCMREKIKPEARMHYVINQGGEAVNVIPDHSQVTFRYRGPNAEDLRLNLPWIKDIARGSALMTQTTLEITELSACYDTLPNQVLSDRMHAWIDTLGVPEWTEEEQAFARAIQEEAGFPVTGMATTKGPDPRGISNGGASDLGDITYIVPTMGALIAAWPDGIPPHHWGCTATNGMSIGHKAAIKAAQVLSATGMDLLTDPELLKAATEEFLQRTGGKPYQSLCHADGHPTIVRRNSCIS